MEDLNGLISARKTPNRPTKGNLAEMAHRAKIFLLGSFRVMLPDATEARFRTSRASELVARLALQDYRRLPRPAIVRDLWPDSDQAEGLNNLRPALHYARTALGAKGAISADKNFLSLNGAVDTDWSELAHLEASLGSSTNPEERLSQLYKLDSLCQKPLLMDWDQEWIEVFRNYHEVRRLRALTQLSEELGSRGDWELALTYAQKITDLDRTAETGIRLQLRFLGELGRQPEAETLYRTYVKNLRAELGLDVSASLKEFAKTMIQGSHASYGARPLTSVQQEFFRHSLDTLAEDEPERLLPLFSSGKLNWAIFLHGSEMRKYVEKALAATTGWSIDRAGTAKRLLQIYYQESELDLMANLAAGLLESLQVSDRIAALNYLAIVETRRGRYTEAQSRIAAAILLAQGAPDPYLHAVSLGNSAELELTSGNYESGRLIIEEAIDGLRLRSEPNALYTSALAANKRIKAYHALGQMTLALDSADTWLRFAEVTGMLTHDADGQAAYAMILAENKDQGATEWLLRAIEATIRTGHKASLIAASVCLLRGIIRLGPPGFGERAAVTFSRLLKKEGQTPSPYANQMLDLEFIKAFTPLDNIGSFLELFLACKQHLA